jgi:hypothetical protein
MIHLLKKMFELFSSQLLAVKTDLATFIELYQLLLLKNI